MAYCRGLPVKNDKLIFFAVIAILGATFAGYFNWLLIQPKHEAAQMKVSPPKSEARQMADNHSTKSWHLLNHMQQEALAPLSQQWESLAELQQHRLLKTAMHYPNLTPEQKQRFHNRLEAWSKLTPEQRKAAREKYLAFRKAPTEKREQVKQMVRQNQAIKTQQPASSVLVTSLPPQP